MLHKNHRTLSLLFALTLIFSTFAMAGEVADTQYGDAGLAWQAKTAADAITLTVSGPDGFYYQETFDGSGASFSVFDAAGQTLADGTYAYELRATPALSGEQRDALAAERHQDPGAIAKTWSKSQSTPSQSGSFAVQGGRIVNPEAAEEAGKAVGDGAQAKAQVFTTDLITQGSACIGFDCTSTESFGFDTLRLKENNLRIKFDDTSSSASFPGNDWQLTANDSTNGGLNHFSIDDITGGKTPFTVEAGAPTKSLYIEDDGDVGLNTNSPVVELHIVDGDSPTLRLEQDGSSGFTPQTWDMAGNEANFFVRDVTNGSKLPLKIKPGAPTDSLYIDTDGSVGLGTDSPAERLQIKGSASPGIGIENTTASTSWNFRVVDAGSFRISADGTGGSEFELQSSGQVNIGPGTSSVFTISPAGDVTANTFTANAVGSSIPDYVFEADYDLMPLDELAAYIAAEKHLPRIPSAGEIDAAGRYDMTAMQLRLLEKVEELTLYTLAQEDTLKAQSSLIEALEARLASLEGGEPQD